MEKTCTSSDIPSIGMGMSAAGALGDVSEERERGLYVKSGFTPRNLRYRI